MAEITKFNLDQKDSISSYYEENGYVVFRKLVDESKIDRFLKAYKKTVKHPLFVYYSQSQQVCMRPKLTSNDYVQESMQNASHLAFFHDFTKYFNSCIYNENVSEALTAISGYPDHISWQNMFFDRSTGTVEHQDSWYLDTEPADGLVGAWYALEDINKESGPFFVIPSSHKIGLLDRKDFPEHKDYVDVVKKLISDKGMKMKPLNVDKGDVIIWSSLLIHGAYSCKDDKYSRKSFTSHFYPKSLVAKDTESQKSFSIYNHAHPRATQNPHLFTAFKYNDYIYNLLVYALYMKQKIVSSKNRIVMRREHYSS
ncbi:phytanoyl-CoA dioxygenase family protein [Pseudomonadota bacterium]